MKLLELENAFLTAKSSAELNKILSHYLAQFGITTFSFTYYYHSHSNQKLKYDFATTNFMAWHKHYLAEGYEDIDATLAWTQKTTLPTFWNVEQQLAIAKIGREKKMRLDALAFGITQGLSIAIYGPQNDFATLTLVQMRGQTCLDNWKELQYELFSAGYYYFYYLQQYLLQTNYSNQYELNPREIQCLTLVAKEFSVAEMAKILKITPRTINFHIQNLNKKLGTKNKYQSVMKAMQEGVIRL